MRASSSLSSRFVFFTIAVTSLGACMDRVDPTSPSSARTQNAQSVTVRLPMASLEVGRVLHAAAMPTNAAGQEVSDAVVQWMSSDTSVLVVNKDGQVRGRKMGTAWVYATNAGIAGRKSLTVTDSIVSRVLVSPRLTSTKVGTPVQLSADVSTATGRALPEHPIVWTSSDSTHAKVSSSGVVTAVSAGTAHIFASATGTTDTATVTFTAAATQTTTPTQPAPTKPVATQPAPTVPVAPTPTTAPIPETETHEPSVMTPIMDWSGRDLGAWSSNTTPKEQFTWNSGVQDTVMQMQYGPVVVPSTSTYGPGHLYYIFPRTGARHSIYLRAQIKLSANWQQNPSGVLKLFEISAGRSWVIPGVHGWGSDLRFMVANDEGTDPNYPGCFVGQTAPTCKVVSNPPDAVTLDTWHTIEVLVVSNTPGVSDGRVTTWLDGRLQTSVSDVMWAAAGTDNSFRELNLNPLWGGLGGTLSSAQWLSLGKVHISASTAYVY